MNSKECLERLYSDARELNSECEEDLKQVEKEYNLIKQELDRLEQLEEEYNYLKIDYDNKDLEWCNLLKENQKLEKAIEILKEKMGLILFTYKPYEIWSEQKSEELTQEEYELLNEVLGNGI